MPNHSYNKISVEKKYADRLMEIANEGLCRYYFPMPEELDVSVSGSESEKPDWQKKSSEELKENYEERIKELEEGIVEFYEYMKILKDKNKRKSFLKFLEDVDVEKLNNQFTSNKS